MPAIISLALLAIHLLAHSRREKRLNPHLHRPDGPPPIKAPSRPFAAIRQMTRTVRAKRSARREEREKQSKNKRNMKKSGRRWLAGLGGGWGEEDHQTLMDEPEELSSGGETTEVETEEGKKEDDSGLLVTSGSESGSESAGGSSKRSGSGGQMSRVVFAVGFDGETNIIKHIPVKDYRPLEVHLQGSWTITSTFDVVDRLSLYIAVVAGLHNNTRKDEEPFDQSVVLRMWKEQRKYGLHALSHLRTGFPKASWFPLAKQDNLNCAWSPVLLSAAAQALSSHPGEFASHIRAMGVEAGTCRDEMLQSWFAILHAVSADKVTSYTDDEIRDLGQALYDSRSLHYYLWDLNEISRDNYAGTVQPKEMLQCLHDALDGGLIGGHCIPVGWIFASPRGKLVFKHNGWFEL